MSNIQHGMSNVQVGESYANQWIDGLAFAFFSPLETCPQCYA